jgi:hypothetical protein
MRKRQGAGRCADSVTDLPLMKLIEIKDFEINYGAPCPVLLADDSQLRLFFNSRPIGERIELSFSVCQFFSFSPPNDEALNGHPYYELGLSSGGFFELLDSDLMFRIKGYNRYHPYNNPNSYNDSHHYIITFKEQLFECVAEGYELTRHQKNAYYTVTDILNQISNPPA